MTCEYGERELGRSSPDESSRSWRGPQAAHLLAAQGDCQGQGWPLQVSDESAASEDRLMAKAHEVEGGRSIIGGDGGGGWGARGVGET